MSLSRKSPPTQIHLGGNFHRPTETAVSRDVADGLRLLSGQKCKIWRNNNGCAKTERGFVRYGLGNGSGDRIGALTMIVTPDMVGCKIAVAVSLEIKTQHGYTKPELRALQEIWRADRVADGWIAGIVHSAGEAWDLITRWKFAK